MKELWKTYYNYIKAHNLRRNNLSSRLKSVLFLVLSKEKEEDDKKKHAESNVQSTSDDYDGPVEIETVYQEQSWSLSVFFQ